MANKNLEIIAYFIVLIVIILLVIFFPYDTEFLTFSGIIFGTIVIYMTFLAILIQILTDREEYYDDIDHLFDDGNGKMIIKDDSSIVKLIEINNKKIIYSEYFDIRDSKTTAISLTVSALISPIFAYIIFIPIAKFRKVTDDFIIILRWISLLLYFPLILFILMIWISFKYEKKNKEIKNFVIISKIYNKININILIDDRILVKNAMEKELEIEIDRENIDEIHSSTLYDEFKEQSEETNKSIKLALKIQSKFIIYPKAMRVDLENRKIMIRKMPEYKSYQNYKSSLFLSTTNHILADRMHERIKIWMKE